jgi:hypothetical protein
MYLEMGITSTMSTLNPITSLTVRVQPPPDHSTLAAIEGLRRAILQYQIGIRAGSKLADPECRTETVRANQERIAALNAEIVRLGGQLVVETLDLPVEREPMTHFYLPRPPGPDDNRPRTAFGYLAMFGEAAAAWSREQAQEEE